MADEAATAGRAAESLYVQLVGDGKSYGNMLNQAVRQTEQASKAIAQETKKITEAVKNDVAEDSAILQHMTESRLAKVGQRAVGSGLIIVGLVKRMLGAFQSFEHGARTAFVEGETTLMRLTGVLEANGAAVEETMEKYEEFANTMKRTSTMSGTQAKQLLANAGNYGMTGDAAMRAVRDAQALAARKGGDPGQWIRALSMLEQGQVAREFMRLTPEIKKAKTEAEKIKLINKFIAESQRFINAEANTAAGRWRQMKNEIGDVMEILGKTIVNAMKPLVKWATEAAKWFQRLDEATQGVISNVLQITALVVAATAAWGIFGGPIKDILFLVWNLLSSFGLMAGAIAAAGYGLWKLGEAAGIFGTLQEAIEGFVTAVTDYFGPAWEALVTAVKSGDLAEAFEVIGLTAQMVWIDISNLFVANWDNIFKWFQNNWKNILTDLGTMIIKVIEGIPEMLTWVLDTAGQLFYTFMGWLGKQFEKLFSIDLAKWFQIGMNAVMNVVLSIIPNIAALFAGAMAGKNLADSIDMESWSKGWQDFFERGGESMMQGFEQDDLIKSLTETWGKRTKNFPNPLKDFVPTTEELPGIITDITQFANEARDKINQVLGRQDTRKEDSLWESFMGDTDEWHQYLEDEFGIIVDTAADYGERSGANFSNEFAKALKFDAAEAGTAEAMARIREFMDTGGIGGGEGQGKGGGALGAVGAGSAGGQWDLSNGPDLGDLADNTDPLADLLRDIKSNTGRDPIVFNEAALA